MSVRIGELRHRITLTVPTPSTDAMGQQTESFGSPIVRWAKVEELPAREEQVYEGTTAKRRISIVFRSPWQGSKTWNERMRVSWQNYTFNVTAVRVIDPHQNWLELSAEAIL